MGVLTDFSLPWELRNVTPNPVYPATVPLSETFPFSQDYWLTQPLTDVLSLLSGPFHPFLFIHSSIHSEDILTASFYFMPNNPGTEYKINQIEVNKKPHSYWRVQWKNKQEKRTWYFWVVKSTVHEINQSDMIESGGWTSSTKGGIKLPLQGCDIWVRTWVIEGAQCWSSSFKAAADEQLSRRGAPGSVCSKGIPSH